MTEIQVGKVMLTFKGEYDSTKTYTRLDAVTYQGSSYVCLADTSSTPPSDSWQLLAGKGADGQPGKDGQPGSPGVTPHIDATTGNWFIGTTNTGVKAQGPAGQNGSDGKPGSNGSDGVSPHIDSTTGHWFVGTTDTGVSARGPQGQQGSPGKDGQTPDVSNLATKTDLANYYTKPETDSAINSSIGKVQIGGRNLLRGTATFEFPFVNNEGTQTIQKYDDETNYIQYTSNTPIDSIGPYWEQPTLKVGQVYTLSADVCGNGHIIGSYFHYEGGDAGSLGQVDLTNDWQRISNTFHVNTASGAWVIYADNSTLLKIKDIKIEKGNVATDWTPAPEDTTTAIQKNTTAIATLNSSAMQNRGTVDSPDFNSLTQTGFYTITDPIKGKNYPISNWGTLEVSGQVTDGNGRLDQKYVSDNDGMTFTRLYNNSNKTWTAWVQVANQYDINTLNGKIATNSTQITDLQTEVKAQQSAAQEAQSTAETAQSKAEQAITLANDAKPNIDSSSQTTSKKPSDYSEGIFHEVKDVSTLGIVRTPADFAPEGRQGTTAFVTTMSYGGMAHQTADIVDSEKPMRFCRNGRGDTWYRWEWSTTD
jgi:hypothetical protein